MNQPTKKTRSPAPDLSIFGKLAEYNRKRRFEVTPEPAGKPKRARKKALEFVVQKHRASRLHYDFRLEHDGVMLSWAVPKGPSLDPANKRFAMQTEDHPIEYNRFEGVIPEGEYGGGTVMIWDRGTWEPEVDDVDAALAKGDLKFTLHGDEAQGLMGAGADARSTMAPDQAPRQSRVQLGHRRGQTALGSIPPDVGGNCAARQRHPTPAEAGRGSRSNQYPELSHIFLVNEDAACRLDFPKGIRLHDKRGNRRRCSHSPRRQ